MRRAARAALIEMRDGTRDPGTPEAQRIIRDALEEDRGVTVDLLRDRCRDPLVSAMKASGYNVSEIAMTAFRRGPDRSLFLTREDARARIHEPEGRNAEAGASPTPFDDGMVPRPPW